MVGARSPEEVRQQIKRIRTVRWVLVAVTVALAVALIVHGNLLIGALVAVMACVRAWTLVAMSRRMDAIRQQRREEFMRGGAS